MVSTMYLMPSVSELVTSVISLSLLNMNDTYENILWIESNWKDTVRDAIEKKGNQRN